MKGSLLVQYQTENSKLDEVLIQNAGGMGYVMRTREGKLIVLDGGNTNDGYRFLELLKELSGQEKPEVEIWFLSHPHGDHYGALKTITEEYLNQIHIKNICCNFPPADLTDTTGHSYAAPDALLKTMLAVTKAEFYEAKTGDGFDVDNIHIDVVTTWEDLARVSDPNETSMILMAYVEGQKILFLADAYPATAKNAIKNYGEKLQCDICQVAHHGINGCTENLYKMTGARLYLLPTNQRTKDDMYGRYLPSTWVYKNAEKILLMSEGTSYLKLPYSFD